MTSKTITVCIVMGESGDYEVATDEDSSLERLLDAADENLTGTICRFVQLNITMSEPFGENGSGGAVDVVVPDDAGHTEEVETS